MNIAFLTPSNSVHTNIKFKYFKGYEEYSIYYFSIKIDKSSHNVNIFDKDVNVIELKQESNSIGDILKNAAILKKIIEKNAIEIVHIIDMSFALYSILLKSKNVKIVLENNGSDILIKPEINHYLMYLYKMSYKFCDAVIQDSEIVKQLAISKYGAPKTNNEVIELGIDLNIFNLYIDRNKFRAKYNIAEDVKIAFSPRAFRDLYNIYDIISTIPIVAKAFNKIKYVFSSYYGDTKYMREIKRRGLEDKVLFLGYVDNETEIPYIYADSDVVISIPSSDSSPRTVYEAIATGSTVIISDIPWYYKKFKDCKREMVIKVPLNNVEVLSDNIIKVLNGELLVDKEYNFSIISELLDYNKSAFKLRALYKKILN